MQGHTHTHTERERERERERDRERDREKVRERKLKANLYICTYIRTTTHNPPTYTSSEPTILAFSSK